MVIIKMLIVLGVQILIAIGIFHLKFNCESQKIEKKMFHKKFNKNLDFQSGFNFFLFIVGGIASGIFFIKSILGSIIMVVVGFLISISWINSSYSSRKKMMYKLLDKIKNIDKTDEESEAMVYFGDFYRHFYEYTGFNELSYLKEAKKRYENAVLKGNIDAKSKLDDISSWIERIEKKESAKNEYNKPIQVTNEMNYSTRCPYLSGNYVCTMCNKDMSYEYGYRDTYCTGVNMRIGGSNPWKQCRYYS